MKRYHWLQFFEDERGKLSAMQLGFLLVIICVIVVWTALSLIHGVVEDIPAGVRTVVFILAGGKFGHLWLKKRGEREHTSHSTSTCKKKVLKKRKPRSTFMRLWDAILERLIDILSFLRIIRHH